MRHTNKCERVTHPNSLHPCNCGIDPGFCGKILCPDGSSITDYRLKQLIHKIVMAIKQQIEKKHGEN